jgi:electron transfer flavoprotein alpha subunit
LQVVAEHNAGAISPDTLAAVTAAKSIGGSVREACIRRSGLLTRLSAAPYQYSLLFCFQWLQVDLLVTGKAAGDAATAAAGIAGVDKVLKAEADVSFNAS